MPPEEFPVSSNVILFGAGASYGSEPAGTRVPPLGAKLYEELCAFSPDLWAALPSPYPDLFRTDFEQGFERLAQDSPSPLSVGFNPAMSYPSHLTGPLLRKMAEFFLQFEPTKDSLYGRLAERIRATGWHGALASLNYDLLLPLSLDRAVLVAQLNLWGDMRSLRVCLPHGCCALLIQPGVLTGQATLVGIGNSIEAPIVFEKNTAVARERLRAEFVPPVMSYFEPLKTAVTAPAFLAQQRSYLSEAVTNADVVTIIGVQVRERDEHIWDPLGLTAARLVYCSRETDGFQGWSDRRRPGRTDVILRSTFEASFDELCRHAGIV